MDGDCYRTCLDLFFGMGTAIGCVQICSLVQGLL